MKLLRYCICLFSVLTWAQQPKEVLQIAFLSDVHLQDIYGQLSDTHYRGLVHPLTEEPVLIRTMAAQLASTRIFNENYYALLTALDDIAQRGIRLVALPGDFSDDGQAIHLRGLQRILNNYRDIYGMEFFITTGNHDPVSPFATEGGKTDFLAADGKNQAIFSQKGHYTPKEDEPEVVISKDIAPMGYDGILSYLKTFGFYPKQSDLYWATPFSSYTPQTYRFSTAQKQAALSNRQYKQQSGVEIPDLSYVVEPVEGLWLMAIDGDIYVPKEDGFQGAGMGYNQVFRYKSHLIDWAHKISQQAEEQGKTLIAFSHFPMVDFNDDATASLKTLLGEHTWQLERVPQETVAEAFAKAGIKVHVAGHMHINDTGLRTYDKDHFLVNIQTPSLAAYMPGYKILKVKDHQEIEVTTVTLDEVSRFNELFPLYENEYTYLKQQQDTAIWNKEVLQAKSYGDFMRWHLKELVRLRFVKQWPEPLKSTLLKEDLQTLGALAGISLDPIVEKLPALSVLEDFHKLRNADLLALRDISKVNLTAYQQLIQAYKKLETTNELQAQLQLFFKSLEAFLNGQPADHFSINLTNGRLKAL